MTTNDILGIISIISAAVGFPTIIGILLNRKGALRKVVVEEKTLEVNQFTAQMQAYQDLLDRSKDEIQELRRILEDQETAINELTKEFKSERKSREDLEHRHEILRDLLNAYIARTGIPLTVSELEMLEQTIPRRKLQ